MTQSGIKLQAAISVLLDRTEQTLGAASDDEYGRDMLGVKPGTATAL